MRLLEKGHTVRIVAGMVGEPRGIWLGYSEVAANRSTGMGWVELAAPYAGGIRLAFVRDSDVVREIETRFRKGER